MRLPHAFIQVVRYCAHTHAHTQVHRHTALHTALRRPDCPRTSSALSMADSLDAIQSNTASLLPLVANLLHSTPSGHLSRLFRLSEFHVRASFAIISCNFYFCIRYLALYSYISGVPIFGFILQNRLISPAVGCLVARLRNACFALTIQAE